MKRFLYVLVLSAILFGAGFLVCYTCVNERVTKEVKVVRDTNVVTYYDTSFFAGPKLTELIVNTRPLDTLWLQGETKVIHDSVFFALPREEVEYRDSSFRAVVSGFLPRLEELEIYQRDRYITIETTKTIVEKPSRWALSVSGGYGVSAKGLAPYIGVGISYNLYTFNRKKPPN